MDGPLLLFLIMLQIHATVSDIRKFLQQELSSGFPEHERTSLVRMIFEHAGYPSPGYILEPMHKPGPDIVGQINEIVEDIHTGRPIQYILGYTLFDNLKMRVDERVLIPRPETEELVALTGKYAGGSPGKILDIGTGSGCIALALKNRYPHSSVTGMDISREALEVARSNGTALGLEVDWLQGDIFRPDKRFAGVTFDLIVSNPPYVKQGEKVQMERNVLDFEPPGALFVEDDDPLVYYSAIARFAREHMADQGRVWLEINEQLGRETVHLLKNEGFTYVELYRDIHEKDRFIEAG
jgi:release factor glutamine methyltransferase